MSSKVEVLCPNGHRVNVQINPNTKLLQVLEEACTKKGFSPTSDFELKHGRKTLDLTLTIRYAGLANNAKLELVKATKTRTESDVIIALQLPDGQRLQQTFSPQTSLWDLLRQFETSDPSSFTFPHPPGHQPVCVFMRDEVVGEYALQQTTLRSLGLTGGKAILRLVFKQVSESALADIKSNIDKEIERQAKIQAKALEQQKGDTQQSNTERSNDEQESLCSSLASAATPGDSSQVARQVSGQVPRQVPEEMDTTEDDGSELETSLSRLVELNATTSSERALVTTPWSFDAAPVNFDSMDTSQQSPTSSQAEKRPRMEQPVQQSLRPSTAPSNPQPMQFPFTEFKFPEATKGKNLYKNEMTEVTREDFQPCPRETVVFTPSDPELMQQVQKQRTDVPDDFFEVRESDIRKMWADLQKKVQDDLEQPLMTQALKRVQKEEYMDRYQRAAIRVHFPNHFIVQGLFRPRETVFALYKFIQEYLEKPTLKFYLYTTPPKTILKDQTKTLIEANLTPMTNVYFGCDIKHNNYLSSSALKQQQGALEADRVLVNFMHAKPPATSAGHTSQERATKIMAAALGATSAVAGPSRASTGSQSTSSRATTSRNTEDQAGTVPKWFKIGKK